MGSACARIPVTVRDSLTPVYRQIVLDVGNPIERAAGMILVQRSWAGAWNFQRALQESLAPPDPLQPDAPTRPDLRVSHQRALTAAQLLSLLQHVRKYIEPPCPPIRRGGTDTSLEKSNSVDQNPDQHQKTPTLALIDAHPCGSVSPYLSRSSNGCSNRLFPTPGRGVTTPLLSSASPLDPFIVLLAP